MILEDPAAPVTSIICTVSSTVGEAGKVTVMLPAVQIIRSFALAVTLTPVTTLLVE